MNYENKNYELKLLYDANTKYVKLVESLSGKFILNSNIDEVQNSRDQIYEQAIIMSEEKKQIKESSNATSEEHGKGTLQETFQ